MKKNKKFQSNSKNKINNNNKNNLTNNTSNMKSTNKQNKNKNVGFEPSSDGSFELDEDSEHSFELRDYE